MLAIPGENETFLGEAVKKRVKTWIKERYR